MKTLIRVAELPSREYEFKNTQAVRSFLNEHSFFDQITKVRPESLILTDEGIDVIHEALMGTFHTITEKDIESQVLIEVARIGKKSAAAIKFEVSVSVIRDKGLVTVALKGSLNEKQETVLLYKDCIQAANQALAHQKMLAWFLDQRSPLYKKDNESSLRISLCLKQISGSRLSAEDSKNIKDMIARLNIKKIDPVVAIPPELEKAGTDFIVLFRSLAKRGIYFDIMRKVYALDGANGEKLYQNMFCITSKIAKPFTYCIGVEKKSGLSRYVLGAKGGIHPGPWIELFNGDFDAQEITPKSEHLKYVLNYFGYRQPWYFGEQIMMDVLSKIPRPTVINIDGKEFESTYTSKKELAIRDQAILISGEYRFKTALNNFLAFCKEKRIQVNGQFYFTSPKHGDNALTVKRYEISSSEITASTEKIQCDNLVEFNSLLTLKFSQTSKTEHLAAYATKILDIISGAHFADIRELPVLK